MFTYRIYTDGGNLVVATYENNTLKGEGKFLPKGIVAVNGDTSTNITLKKVVDDTIIISNIGFSLIRDINNTQWGANRNTSVTNINAFILSSGGGNVISVNGQSGVVSLALGNLNNVNVSGATQGDVISYNSSGNWILNGGLQTLLAKIKTPTNQTIVEADTSNKITIDPTAQKVIVTTNGTTAATFGGSTALLPGLRVGPSGNTYDLPAIRGNATGQVPIFDAINNTTTFKELDLTQVTGNTDDITEGSNNLFNVNADWNVNDPTSGAYIANRPTIPAEYDNADVDTHLNTATATTGQVLSWNGTDYDWVNDQGGLPAGNSGEIQFNNAGSFGASSNLFYDAVNNRLGVGTNIPTAPLEVQGTSAGLTNILKVTKAGGSSNYFSIFSNTSDTSRFDPSFLGYNTSDTNTALQFIGGVAAAYDTGTNPIVNFQARRGNTSGAAVSSRDLFNFANYATSVMRIKANGDVGIGTTTPAYKLDVNGQINAVSNTFPVLGFTRETTEIGGSYGTTAGIASAMFLNTKTNGIMSDGFGGGIVFNLNDSATTSNNYVARLYARRDGTNTTGALEFFIGSGGNTSAMIIRGNGNVGINTSTPTYKLDVNGTTRIQSDLTVTTTNATGDFATIDASNILRKRTAAQVLTDIGAQAALTNPITGTGASGQVAFWNASNTQTGDNGLFWDNTNKRLGIGTITPAAQLTIETGSISLLNGNLQLDRFNEGAIRFGLAGNMWGEDTANNVILQKLDTTKQFNFNTQGGSLTISDTTSVLTSFSITTAGMQAYRSFTLKYNEHAATTNNNGQVFVLDNSSSSNGQRGLASVTGDVRLLDYSSSSAVERLRIRNNGTITLNNANNNTLIGSGWANLTASNTTAVGYQALTALTTGEGNTAIGYQAGDGITTSGFNTLVGFGTEAGSSNSSTVMGYQASGVGSRVVAIGYQAQGGGVTNGWQNVGIGYQANFQGASENAISLGYQAGYNGTVQSVSIGGNAGFNGSDYSVMVGQDAGKTATANNTVAIGFQALTALTTGTGNTAIGYQAGLAVTTGINNIHIGYATGDNNNSYTTLIGYTAKSAGNNAVSIGWLTRAGNQSTSIGTLAGANGGGGQNNVYIGDSSGRFNTGANNVIIGRYAGYNSSTSSNSIFIGYQAGENETGSNKLYIENSNSSSPLIYGEFDNDLIRINGRLEVANENTLRLYELATNGTNYIALKSPTALSADVTYTLPVEGVSGQALVTNGSGTLSWEYPKAPVKSEAGTAYTLVVGDAGKYIRMTATTAITVTIPENTFAVGDEIMLEQNNTGQVTIAAGTGVTLRNTTAFLSKTAERYAIVGLKCVASNEFVLTGERELV